MSKISDLIARVEGASGHDTALVCDIQIATGLWRPPPGAVRDKRHPDRWVRDGINFYQSYTPILTSLDAAVAFCERIKPNGMNAYGFDVSPRGIDAFVSRNCVEGGHWLVEASAPTPALALVLAALRAKEAEEGGLNGRA